MHKTLINGNGDFGLTSQVISYTRESTIYCPANIGSATLTLGWKDFAGTFVPYEDGALVAGDSKRLSSGQGVEIQVQVTNHSVNFELGFAD